LSEEERYGYEIIKTVNERSGGVFAWKEGTLYPWLHRLEGDGLIQSRWVEADTGRRRKYYRITRRGRTALVERKEEWSAFAQAVNALLCVQPA
jgi:DNA-binding PadR family transcriptional regulator